jgi:hypothetical protein
MDFAKMTNILRQLHQVTKVGGGLMAFLIMCLSLDILWPYF